MMDFQQEKQLDGIDRLALVVEAFRANPAITDEEMAKVLGLLCLASARFWRLKAYYIVYGSCPHQ